MGTQASIDLINTMYVAYYGRPGDSIGREFWTDLIEENGGEMSPDILAEYGTSQEYTDQFGSLSNGDLIENLYAQMFNRTADVGGKAFWLNELNTGLRTLSDAALAIAQGATGTDKTILDNKVEVADYYTGKLTEPGIPEQDFSEAKVIIAAVSADPTSVATQKAAVDAFFAPSAGAELMLFAQGIGADNSSDDSEVFDDGGPIVGLTGLLDSSITADV